jgi:AraC-like DNA-binding protein
MPPRLAAFQLYLPPEPHPNVWGLHPTDLGFTRIPPGHPYPPFPHPESYTLNHDEGRSLDEYQLIYISRGRGSFWSERSQAARVAAGTVILLFPGIRHRYRPDPATGWDEHWLGFAGDHAQRIMSALFAAEQPLHHVGPHAAIRAHFTASCALARREAAGYREKVGVHILAILAELNLLVPARPLSTRGDEVRVRRACTQMIQNLAKPFDSARFAREQGMSHTSFRRHFRARMGISPIQYLLNLRLRRATQLLRQTTQPVKVIAQECGFDNPYHFSKQFRKRLGQSPSEIRRGTQ